MGIFVLIPLYNSARSAVLSVRSFIAINNVESTSCLESVGTTEIVLIFALLLFLFGARKLPELVKGIGRAITEFKRETLELRNDIENLRGRTISSSGISVTPGKGN
jgi:sec-independent protein translocase protein TatA